MIDRYETIKHRICEHARQDSKLHAVIVIGSSTRSDVPADEYSDLDLIIVTDSPKSWYSGEYSERLGKVSISFLEPTLGGGMERRCIYDEDKDVDMIIFTPEQYKQALKDGVAGWVMNRGYRFLYDSADYTRQTAQYIQLGVSHSVMTEEEFLNLVNDFYFHNIWAAKKLRRGELWSAKMCIDAYLKERLLKMIEECRSMDVDVDVWHDGRFLDRWAGDDIRKELEDCFAHYDTEDCVAALRATHELFSKLALHVATTRGYSFPEKAKACAAKQIDSRLFL